MAKVMTIKIDKVKTRNLIAVAAFQRSGGGRHKNAKAYNRKTKHFKGWE